MKETTVGRQTCSLCGGTGKLPILALDPPRHDGDALCPCAVQILWDGRTLWVNGEDGGSIARFGPAGIDIHRTQDEQLAGAHPCLSCEPASMVEVFSGKVGREHQLWPQFEAGLRHHYGIVIPEDFA